VERADDVLQHWVKVIDQDRCIGWHACTTACKSENEVPLGVTRTYVKSVEVGAFPQVRRAFQVTRCNQCADAPCVAACPTRAMYRRPDGIVDFDKQICVGCKACIAACPYDAIFINPEDNSAEKCNLCAHRLEVGLEPAPWLGPRPAVTGAEVLLAAAAGAHVLLVLGEITVTHPTEHARLAAGAMKAGRYAGLFWPGLAAAAVAVSAPWTGAVAVPFALAGLLAHEHAYVQAGQSVPLA